MKEANLYFAVNSKGEQPEEIACRIEKICRYIQQTVAEVEPYVESINPVNQDDFLNAWVGFFKLYRNFRKHPEIFVKITIQI
ncbi:hypothetical protein V7266_25790 [Neobacillus drentensis]|uniref:hypothetical protein n=1 Tax=Neobacillus drentensis TaxID=220684 RepID=UPI002FFDF567